MERCRLMRDDLSHCEVLAIAIQAEIDARKFYEDMAERSDKPKIGLVFSALARDEADHEARLKQRATGLTCASIPRNELAVRMPRRDFVETATELEAIKFAIQGETKAREFYAWAAERATDAAGREMFEELVSIEEGHQKLLESEYKARGGQPWSEYELDTWVRE
jgi:rubrerythrin